MPQLRSRIGLSLTNQIGEKYMQKFSKKIATNQQLGLRGRRLFMGFIVAVILTVASISVYAAPVLITMAIRDDGKQLILSCESSAGDHFMLVGGGEVEYLEFPPGYAHQRCVEEGFPNGF
jgi:hypothetical protein